jgi:hypothetical protein
MSEIEKENSMLAMGSCVARIARLIAWRMPSVWSRWWFEDESLDEKIYIYCVKHKLVEVTVCIYNRGIG